MVTTEEMKKARLAYIADAQHALEMLTTNLTVVTGNGDYHIWQEVRNVERTLKYIGRLINEGEEE